MDGWTFTSDLAADPVVKMLLRRKMSHCAKLISYSPLSSVAPLWAGRMQGEEGRGVKDLSAH